MDFGKSLLYYQFFDRIETGTLNTYEITSFRQGSDIEFNFIMSRFNTLFCQNTAIEINQHDFQCFIDSIEVKRGFVTGRVGEERDSPIVVYSDDSNRFDSKIKHYGTVATLLRCALPAIGSTFGIVCPVPKVVVLRREGERIEGAVGDSKVKSYNTIAPSSIGSRESSICAGSVGVAVPGVAVAGCLRFGTGIAVVDGEVERYHTVAPGSIGSRESGICAGSVGVAVPGVAVAG